MDKNTENIIDVVTVDEKKNKTKKNIIKVVSIFSASAIGLCALGGVVLYNIVKSNINYTEQQAKEIAQEKAKKTKKMSFRDKLIANGYIGYMASKLSFRIIPGQYEH